ncbi:colanic acid/amylovoran biosynthesis protein [Lutibacter oceani]|uniref:Colanic acid/amylovoran biosynthesis protein n=1 Tax=Lutibacter oceani TaxID=1853311 RepID=A0A3D9RZ08_9FLAO|nr:polysaccharide pyruvyl transferase family protein [Lutibacter oceani]REE83091.1 colanic acid/amylovoran biosynthesis protein [Lutibacter oceani]
MKKILVDIYLAFNLGDDLFLDVLAKRYPNYEITILHPGDNYNSFFKQYKNVKKLPYSYLNKGLRKIGIYNVLTDYKKFAKKYDVLLFLGGGIFREESYSESLLKYRYEIISSFNKNNKKIFFLGCSFGPFKSKDFYTKYFNLFKLCDDICFRDLYSFNLFKSLKNVRYAPDILWSYNLKKYELKDNNIGYSLINPKHKLGLSQYYYEYLEYTSKSIIKNIKRGYKINLLSFCEQEGDLIVVEEILKNIPIEFKEHILVSSYNGDIEAMLEVISKLKCLVAARFHAVLLGLLSEINVIPVIYSNKTKNLLKDIKFKGTVIEFENLQLLENIECITETLKINNLKVESESHFLKLDQYLMRK